MRAPGLPAAHFALDPVLDRRVLYRPDRPTLHSGPHPLVIPLPLDGADLTDADALVLTLENRSDTAFCLGLRLIHQGGPDRVSLTGGREPLEPGGPKEIFFPMESSGAYGQPDGWRQVMGVELIARREKDRTGPTVLEVAVVEITALRRRLPPGPRLTEAGLTAVIRNTSCGREASLPPGGDVDWGLAPPVHPYPADSLPKVLAGRIMGQPVGFPPDWSADPLGQLEWRHFLHRHHFLRPLARALQRTGQARLAMAARLAMEHWIAANPVPVGSDGGAGPAWETLSAAFRLREWLRFPRRVYSRLILRSVWEHARHLLDHQGHPGNWRLLETAALALTGLNFPEFHEAAVWVETGLTRLEREAAIQFFPDGLHFEISPLYHALCAEACLAVRHAARRQKIAVPEIIEAGLPRWFSALAALARPNFSWPSVNDAGGINGDYRSLSRRAGAALSLPEARFAGSRGRFGQPFPETCRIFPDAGLAVLRSGWNADALAVLFRAGPPGAAHVHEDDLSLELSAGGRPILVDPGIGGYAPSPRTEAYRRAEAHSCLMVPGRMPRRAVLPWARRSEPAGEAIRLLHRPGLDVALGRRTWDGLAVTRSVALAAGRFVLIRDEVQGQGRTEARVHWQFAPGALEAPAGLVFLPLPGGPAPLWAKQTNGRVVLGSQEVTAPHLEYAFEDALPLVLFWVFAPRGQEAPWEVARIGPEVVEVGPARGPVYRLDAVAWELTLAPGRTSGETRS